MLSNDEYSLKKELSLLVREKRYLIEIVNSLTRSRKGGKNQFQTWRIDYRGNVRRHFLSACLVYDVCLAFRAISHSSGGINPQSGESRREMQRGACARVRARAREEENLEGISVRILFNHLPPPRNAIIICVDNPDELLRAVYANGGERLFARSFVRRVATRRGENAVNYR